MAGVKGKGSIVREAEFNRTKKLLSLGVTFKEAAEITQRSSTLIGRIHRAKDWAEYQDNNAKYYGSTTKIREKVARAEKEALETPEQKAFEINQNKTYTVNEDNTNIRLTRIAMALERIATVLEDSKEKKGWLR
jgi:N-glycosylase/DNA lyase